MLTNNEQYLGQLARAPGLAKAKLSVKKALAETKKLDTRPFRKARGVYYTPRWVVRLIVGATLGRFLDEHPPDAVRHVRVLDPACGSGSFLIESFQLLAEYWRKMAPPKDSRAELAQRVGILTDNMFGVDLDPQAVEIAQLNLLLVALTEKALLPDLAHNIVVGNSLVDVGRPDAFDYAAAFPFAVDPGRFDVVIGNPPYIRSQTLNEADRDAYKDRYKTAQGSFDTYQLFIERALELVTDGGRVGFIVPGKFLSASGGEAALLSHIYSQGNIELLVDAMRQKVFESALTYPVILVAQRGASAAGHRFGLVTSLRTEGAEITWEDRLEPIARTLAEPLLPTGWTTVGALARVSQGLVTGADSVFALRGARLEGTSRLRSATLGRVVEIESELLRPLVSGSRDVSRFTVTEPKEWLLFPYRNGKLIPETTMVSDHSLAWGYLDANRDRLEARDGGDMKGATWYGYSRTQNLTAIWQPKAIVPYMSNAARAAADPAGQLAIVNVTTGGYFVAPHDPSHLDYLTAALNSAYAGDWWMRHATPHAGGYFGLTARAIAFLPVPDPNSLPADILAAASAPTDAADDPFGRVLGGRLADLQVGSLDGVDDNPQPDRTSAFPPSIGRRGRTNARGGAWSKYGRE